MRFWIREIAGWVLVGLGLWAFYVAYQLLTQVPGPPPSENQGHYLLEAGPLAFIGFILFRGGIHLLKVAVAARICLQAQERLRPEREVRVDKKRPPRTGAEKAAPRPVRG